LISHDDGVLHGNNVIKLIPDQTVVKLNIGRDRIQVRVAPPRAARSGSAVALLANVESHGAASKLAETDAMTYLGTARCRRRRRSVRSGIA
jgi:hypothetical protein